MRIDTDKLEKQISSDELFIVDKTHALEMVVELRRLYAIEDATTPSLFYVHPRASRQNTGGHQMKDRNGVELQEGDVCVVHGSNDDTFIEWWNGCIVVVDCIDESDFDNEYPINCSGIEPHYVTGTDFKPNELEIIGSVRDE